MSTSKTTRPCRYAARTVRAAHRRVLKMIVEVVAEMPAHDRSVLRAWGGGVVTLDEVAYHARAALALVEK